MFGRLFEPGGHGAQKYYSKLVNGDGSLPGNATVKWTGRGLDPVPLDFLEYWFWGMLKATFQYISGMAWVARLHTCNSEFPTFTTEVF